MTPSDTLPALRDIPFLPVNAEQELVFSNPWEARAFAMVVQLHQRGCFTWPEWAEHLGAEIKAAGSGDDGQDYYLLWLAAAEKLIDKKSWCTPAELRARKVELESAQGGPAPV